MPDKLIETSSPLLSQQTPNLLPPTSSPSIQYAGFVIRLCAWLLDFLILIPIMLFMVFFRAYLYRVNPGLQTGYFVLLIPFFFPIYNIVLLKFFATTLGKRLLRLKVVSETASQLTIGQIILRETLGKLVSTTFFDLGYLWIIFDSKKQSWHDKISKTRVVRDLTIASVKKDVIRYLGIFSIYGLVFLVGFSVIVTRIYQQNFPCGRNPKRYLSFEEAFKEPNKVCILQVSSQKLTKIPPGIKKLSNLYHFTLSNNEITELPPEIGSLKKLILLDLYDNKLTQLPPEIGELSNLQQLILAYNKLTHLPPEISKLEKLTVLDLNGNLFSQEEKERLKQLFPEMPIIF